MIKGTATIESGMGSVEALCGCNDDGLGVILMRSHPPYTIGPIKDGWDGSDAEIVWYFNNIESLDSMIDLMNHLKDSMVAAKEKAEAGCERCRSAVRSDETFHVINPSGIAHNVVFNFCPVCGRKLPKKE